MTELELHNLLSVIVALAAGVGSIAVLIWRAESREAKLRRR